MSIVGILKKDDIIELKKGMQVNTMHSSVVFSAGRYVVTEVVLELFATLYDMGSKIKRGKEKTRHHIFCQKIPTNKDDPVVEVNFFAEANKNIRIVGKAKRIFLEA